MIVSPDARDRGIGSRLLEYCIGFSRENGCKRITLLTESDNEFAQRFYQKHGFHISSMVPFRLSLE